MSMKKWTDEELIATRDRLENWNDRQKRSGTKMWHFTAFLGAFAISTGVVFSFMDGIDVLNILLIILGTVTCISWYKSEKQRKDNQTFLTEINKELKHREKKAAKSKTGHEGSEKNQNKPEDDEKEKEIATTTNEEKEIKS